MLSVHGRNGRYFEGKILEVCTSSTGSISGIHYRHREYSEYFEPLSCGYCHTSSISGTGIRTAILAVYTRSTKCVRYSRVYGQHLCKAHHHGAATRAHLPSLRRVVRLRPGAFRLPEQLHDVNVQRREVLQDLANNERQRAVRVFSVWPITGTSEVFSVWPIRGLPRYESGYERSATRGIPRSCLSQDNGR